MPQRVERGGFLLLKSFIDASWHKANIAVNVDFPPLKPCCDSGNRSLSSKKEVNSVFVTFSTTLPIMGMIETSL